MTTCSLCGRKTDRQPPITEEAACDICGKKVVVKEDRDWEEGLKKSPDDAPVKD